MTSTKNTLKKIADFELSVLERQFTGNESKWATTITPMFFGAIGGAIGNALGDGLSGAFAGATIGGSLGFAMVNGVIKTINAVNYTSDSLKKLQEKVSKSNLSYKFKRFADFELATLNRHFDWGWRTSISAMLTGYAVGLGAMTGLAAVGLSDSVTLSSAFNGTVLGGLAGLAFANASFHLQSGVSYLKDTLKLGSKIKENINLNLKEKITLRGKLNLGDKIKSSRKNLQDSVKNNNNNRKPSLGLN